MMILHTPSLTQQKVVNYSGPSLADHTGMSQQSDESRVGIFAFILYLHSYNDMTITRTIILIYIAPLKTAASRSSLQKQHNKDKAVKRTGKY